MEKRRVDIINFLLDHNASADIQDENGEPVIGNLPVKVEDNKIIIGDKEYVSTPQLWALIMQKSPDMNKIDDDTVQEYKELIADAGVREWVEDNYKGSYECLKKQRFSLKKVKVKITLIKSFTNIVEVKS